MFTTMTKAHRTKNTAIKNLKKEIMRNVELTNNTKRRKRLGARRQLFKIDLEGDGFTCVLDDGAKIDHDEILADHEKVLHKIYLDREKQRWRELYFAHRRKRTYRIYNEYSC